MKHAISVGVVVLLLAFIAPLARANGDECVVVSFSGTAEKIENKDISNAGKGEVRIDVTCDSEELVELGPPVGKSANPEPTYVRITALLNDGSKEYVQLPLSSVCLKETKGDDDSATYEAADPNGKTKLQMKLRRKEIGAQDCALGVPCSRYEARIRVDKATIEDTTESSCLFTTAFEIFEGSLASLDGTCPTGDELELTMSTTALWTNKKFGDCDSRSPGLRHP